MHEVKNVNLLKIMYLVVECVMCFTNSNFWTCMVVYGETNLTYLLFIYWWNSVNLTLSDIIYAHIFFRKKGINLLFLKLTGIRVKTLDFMKKNVILLCFNKFTTFQRNKSENKMKVLPYHLSFKVSFSISNQNASLLIALTNSILK